MHRHEEMPGGTKAEVEAMCLQAQERWQPWELGED